MNETDATGEKKGLQLFFGTLDDKVLDENLVTFTEIKKQFQKFIENITLTPNQTQDAKRKYTSVCKLLHDHFYPDLEYSPDKKFLFGSYKKKTAILPFSSDQDVDVLFKLPKEEYDKYDQYESNGQSALLAKIRDIISEKYQIKEKIKAWGKVVLIEMSDNRHNIELLPAFEKDDGSFIIPNTESGGSWDGFNPRQETKHFFDSCSKSHGLTRDLSKALKSWNRENATMKIKSYEIENYVIGFLQNIPGEDFTLTPEVILSFFKWFRKKCPENVRSFVDRAISRSQKAIQYQDDEKFYDSSLEWRKIFGNKFPACTDKNKTYLREHRAINEQFIEELYPVSIQSPLILRCIINQNGYRARDVNSSTPLPKQLSLKFQIDNSSQFPVNSTVKWKIRNFGKEAEEASCLRGEIIDGHKAFERKETTAYSGTHSVECYVIVDGMCIAKAQKKIIIN